MRFTLPENVEYIIASLGNATHRADIVGGSVRDMLLGKIPDDYDIATSATPEVTKSVFNHLQTVDTGIKHGTVSVIIDHNPYEITTYRVDGEYKDSRHPESVSFTAKIEEDLARRDFTVNAMAYSPLYGLTDPYGGRADLTNRIIRAVGDPELRFREDALRILRGIRFSSSLGFEIEEKTASAIRNAKHLLKNVSSERIYIELKKTFMADFSYDVIYRYSDVLTEVLTPLDRIILPAKDRYEKADWFIRFVSVFALGAESSVNSFDAACRFLRTETNIRTLGVKLLSSLGKYDLQSKISLNHAVKDLGIEGAVMLVKLEVLLGADETNVNRIVDLINSGVVSGVSDLSVNGNDIISLGIKGKSVGDTLNKLLNAVIDEKCPNDKTKLLGYAKGLLNNEI